MDERLQRFYCKVEKYSEGVHYLNKSIDYDSIKLYEEKYCINIPNTLKEFLQKSNGGELFALHFHLDSVCVGIPQNILTGDDF